MEWLRLFAATTNIDVSGLPNHNPNGGVTINHVLSIVFAITGSMALLVITIAGFRYIISQGDPNAVSQAKQAIIYAIVGLLVSLVAFSMVTFVVQNL